MADSAKWYVIHTYSGYENKVANNIETVVENRQMQDQILEVKIPMETVTEIKDNKKRDVERKVFPGYVLVKLAVDVEDGEYVMSDDTWYVIRNTRGVTGFVGPESKPIPLSDEEVHELLDHSQQLIDVARKLSAPQIGKLMGISDKLADLNATRFHDWQPNFTPENARQAILAFKGDVYTGLQAETFSEADFDFAQQHLRMLSGLYGVLRPLDLMQPYRLEMGIRLENAKGKDLYQFWGDIITDKLNEALAAQGDQVVINLASDEYFRSVKPKKLNAELIKPVFLDEKNGKFKVISFYAKKARGLMSRYIIENRLTKPEQLADFNSEGYFFDEAASGNGELVFKRHQQ